MLSSNELTKQIAEVSVFVGISIEFNKVNPNNNLMMKQAGLCDAEGEKRLRFAALFKAGWV